MSPINVLFPKGRAEIFRLLFPDPARSLHLRELVRLSGLTVGTMQGEVSRLTEAGFLRKRRDGNRLYFSANQEHPLFPELRVIALKTTGLVERLAGALDGVAGIELAFVFGSFASGTSEPQSDVDVFLVGAAGLRQVAPRLRPVAETIGREINPYVISQASLREKAGAGDAFIESVLSSPRLWIKGSDHELEKLAK